MRLTAIVCRYGHLVSGIPRRLEGMSLIIFYDIIVSDRVPGDSNSVGIACDLSLI